MHVQGRPDSSETPRDVLLEEILQQPQAIVDAGDAVEEQLEPLDAVRQFARSAAGPILLTGMGSSFDALTSLATVLGGHGVPAMAVNAAELVRFRPALLAQGALVVAVSQSGLSAELVRLAELNDAGHDMTLVSVTNGLDNPLAAAADVHLDMRAGAEVGPATKTYACTTVVLAALARLLVEQEAAAAGILAEVRAAASSAADATQTLLAEHEMLARRLSSWLGGRLALALVGRGRALGCADVGALILKEAAHFPAWSMDAAEFRHGPLELAGQELAVILVGLEQSTLGLDARLLDDVAGRGGAVLSVGRQASTVLHDHVPTPEVDPIMDSAVAAVPLQLLAWTLAHERNPNPGVFVAGSKVTTQE